MGFGCDTLWQDKRLPKSLERLKRITNQPLEGRVVLPIPRKERHLAERRCVRRELAYYTMGTGRSRVDSL